MDGDETFSHGLLDLRDEFILTAVAVSEARFTTEGNSKEEDSLPLLNTT